MNILITGSHGFVGRAFRRALPHANLTLVDLKQGVDCRKFFQLEKKQYDLVIHLAAVVGGRMLIENEPLALAVDLAIDAEFASWAMRTKQPYLVYFSSSAAYPIELQTLTKKRRLKEKDINFNKIGKPDMTYGWSKLTGEMLMNYLREEDTKVLTLRPFSGYGTDQDLDYPFPSIIERAIMNANPFNIWGKATTTRDFIHIDDIVDAVITMVRNDCNQTVNLCTGRPTTFMDLATIALKVLGHEKTHRKNFKVLTDKPAGVAYRVGDPTMMSDYYTPKISLEEGVERAIRGIV
jgi:nucleoside-diphosphate-sugar epimerase